MVKSPNTEELGIEAPRSAIRPLQAAIRDFEHAYLLRALRATEGKRARTAELLGISRKTLWEKLRGTTDVPESGRAWAPEEAGVSTS
jgi:DNA-binding NtrC family response regulator